MDQGRLFPNKLIKYSDYNNAALEFSWGNVHRIRKYNMKIQAIYFVFFTVNKKIIFFKTAAQYM